MSAGYFQSVIPTTNLISAWPRVFAMAAKTAKSNVVGIFAKS
jgi:hypothetical protein